MRDDRERLLDILDALDRIDERMPTTRKDFEADELLPVWAVHHLQVIGEAARGLPLDLRSVHRQTPWSVVIGTRTVLSHEYVPSTLVTSGW